MTQDKMTLNRMAIISKMTEQNKKKHQNDFQPNDNKQNGFRRNVNH